MDLAPRPVLVVILFFAGIFLFTPYEAYLEGILAVAIVAAAAVGFAMYPRKDIFYVRTAVRLTDADRNQLLSTISWPSELN
jgi:ABC-type uncharacterized transport system permease subunit